MAFIIALHVPPQRTPRVDVPLQTLIVAVAAGAVAASAWLPQLLANRQSVVVQDTLAPAGLAVRVMAVVLVGAFVGLLPGLLRRLLADRKAE